MVKTLSNRFFYKETSAIRLLLCLSLIFITFCAGKKNETVVQVASKNFPESFILAEIAAQLLEAHNIPVNRKFGLGGTLLCFEALKSNDVQIYPEYTGTIQQAILKTKTKPTKVDMNRMLESYNVRLGPVLGFNNTYAIAMNQKLASKLNISKISNLAAFKELNYGFSHEFLKRKDGFEKLADKYNLTNDALGMEHSLSYQALAAGKIDVIDVYTTDAQMQRYKLTILEDDLNFFPRYDALFLINKSLDSKTLKILEKIQLTINTRTMQELNAMAVIKKRSYTEIASLFLKSQNFKVARKHKQSRLQLLFKRLLRHIFLTFTAVGAAIVFALTFSFLVYNKKTAAAIGLYIVGLFQTIPSIAVLAFMIPLLGTGVKPAIAALFFYSLLPVFRSTNSALNSIDPALKQVGQSIGLTRTQILKHIEIPLAVPNILAGIRTATIISIGTATLAAFIGAGGLGEPIFAGVTLNDPVMIMEGAIPAALLAIVAELLFEVLERKLVPKHLRMSKK